MIFVGGFFFHARNTPESGAILIMVYLWDSLQDQMKKKLSGLGILLMLMLKHPPLPEYNLFQKTTIVEVRSYSLKQIALEFFLN